MHSDVHQPSDEAHVDQPLRSTSEEVAGILTQDSISPSPKTEDPADRALPNEPSDGASEVTQAQLPLDPATEHTAFETPGRVTTADLIEIKADIQELRSQLERLQSSCGAHSDTSDETGTSQSNQSIEGANLSPILLTTDISNAPAFDNSDQTLEKQAGAPPVPSRQNLPLPSLEVGFCEGKAACRMDDICALLMLSVI